MNSSTVKKRRRKVFAARRILNSTSNRSLSVLTLGNKRRMTALLKNNKTLAMALQDARCELSTKQKLLESTTKHSKDIMQARINMLEIYSTLKSCMKRFDDTLQLLKLDDMTISDLTVPFQSCSKFKSKIKDLAASVEKVAEEDSFSIEEEKNVYNNGIIKSSNQMISKISHSSNIDCIPMEITDRLANKIKADIEKFRDSSPLVSRENTSFIESRNIADIDPIPSVLFCENSKGILDPCEGKQISSAESDLLKDRESLGTPKLIISDIEPLINTKVSTNFKTCLSYENCSSPVENPSKISNPPVLPSLKVWSSKIPRLQDIPVRTKKSNLLLVISKGKAPCQETLNITKESDINMCRRKTFVVKNSDISAANPESNVSLNEGGIMNENSSNNIEDSEKMSRRKTFVVNSSDTLENELKSLCDRRKTFVKKADGKIKLHKSRKSKRNTFLSSEIEENCGNHSENATPVENSIDAISHKKLCVSSSEMKITEELPSTCSNTNEGTQNFNAFQKLISSEISSDTRMIPSDIHTQEYQFQDKLKKEANESAQKMKESQPEKGNRNVKDKKENLFKAEKLTDRVLICNSIDQKNEYEISNIGSASQSSSGHVIQNDDNDIQFLSSDENMDDMKKHTRVSNEKFLESSNSNCEVIPDLDFLSFEQESSIKSIPVRRKISASKQKKVFVFNTHKRKSVPGKNSVEKLPKNSKNHSKYVNVCNEYPQSNSTSTKSQDDNSSTVKNVNREKAKKNVSFDITAKVCISETVSKAQSDICGGGQEMLQITTVYGKNMETSGNDKEAKKQDNFTSESTVSNSDKNISPHINYSHVIMSDKFLNTIELESNNLDLKSKTSRKENDSINNEAKSKIRKCKSTKVKRFSLNRDIPIDVISVKKNTKRNNSKKQSKEIIASDLEEGNMIDLLIRNKNEVKTRKQSKSKGKSRKKAQVSVSKNNTIVVEAEVHPPPHFLKIPETEVLNKENKETPGPENFQVSVVLNDIFQSKNIDVLTLSCKDKLVSEGRTSKVPLSDNSSNILALTADCHNSKNEGNIANFEEIKTTKRTRVRNYAEPSLRKKLRR